MSDTIVGKTLTAGLLIACVVVLAVTDYSGSTVIYDCSMAEWHPDVPPKVKEECRKKRMEDIKRQDETSKKVINT